MLGFWEEITNTGKSRIIRICELQEEEEGDLWREYRESEEVTHVTISFLERFGEKTSLSSCASSTNHLETTPALFTCVCSMNLSNLTRVGRLYCNTPSFHWRHRTVPKNISGASEVLTNDSPPTLKPKILDAND